MIPKILMPLGLIFLVYALLGNYIALPGYIIFLERGNTSAAGNSYDADVLWGAIKTIVWMFSFQLGIICLAVAYAIKQKLHTASIVVCCIFWLALWAWPSLPAPGPWFYVSFGIILLISISTVILQEKQATPNKLGSTLFLLALIFFALATWEICGLGSTGRMLHPEQAANPMALNLLLTQSSKLMIELVLAWGLMLSSIIASRKHTKFG